MSRLSTAHNFIINYFKFLLSVSAKMTATAETS
jgi:hypothetical protein